MSQTLLIISILFLLTLITLHNTAAKPLRTLKNILGKRSIVGSTIKSDFDTFKYLTKYGYNSCDDERKLETNNKTSIKCQVDLQSMIKNFQSRYNLPVTGKLDEETLKLMNTPRCCVKDYMLAFKLLTPWLKKSFTWKLTSRNFPSFGENKTREQLRESFNDWARYAPITFKEVSTNEKADFDIAFTMRANDLNFDGQGNMLGYAFPPTNGTIRFDAEEPWTKEYNGNDINFRLVATHEIGHALGLDHSYDKFSIMLPFYQPIQPKDLLSKDDRLAIQMLYGRRTFSNSGRLKYHLKNTVIRKCNLLPVRKLEI